MKTTTVISVMMFGAFAAQAQDKPIDRSKLPPAVAATADRETSGSEVKRYLTEREHGQMFYEVETIKEGHTRDLEIAKDGALVEVEEEVAFDTLPAAVKASLTAKANDGSVKKVESLTKRGRLVAYEAVVEKGGRRHEVQVGPAGETLAHGE